MKKLLFVVLGLACNIYGASSSPKPVTQNAKDAKLAHTIILSNLFDDDTVATLKKFSKTCFNEKIGKKQNTLLITATHEKKEKTIQWLITEKADLDAADTDGNTALHYAVFAGSMTIIDILRNNGAIEKANKNGHTPSELTLKFKDSKELQDHLKLKHDEHKKESGEK